MNELNKAELRNYAERALIEGTGGNGDPVPAVIVGAEAILSLLDELEDAQRGMKYSHAIRLKKTIEDLEAERDAALVELEACRKDADRYRWLRQAEWWRSPICVIRNPKDQAKPGSDCPSNLRLDSAIDAAMSQEQSK